MMPNDDSADDELGQVGDQWVLPQLLGRQIATWRLPLGLACYCDEERDGDADQRQRLGQRETDPHVRGDPARGLGCRAMASMACPKTRPMPMPGPDRGQAVGQRPEVN